jgi:DNA-directed RNA polymerase alpha subunit
MRGECSECYEHRIRPVALSESVTALGFSVRALNCLRDARIFTIGDLVALETDDLRRIRNLGKGTLREIVGSLAKLGLRLGFKGNPPSGSVPSPVRTALGQPDGDILRSRVEVLKLGVRAANCLQTIGVTTVEELVKCRPEDLLRTRNLGATTLRQIATVLAKHSLKLGMDENAISIRTARAPEPQSADTTKDTSGPSILSSGVHTLNLGVRASNCLQVLGIHTVQELIEWSASDLARTRNLGSRTLQEIVAALSRHELSLRESQPQDHPIEVFRRTLRAGMQTAEEELEYVVTEVISPRKRGVVVLRLGWSGERIRTLEELAENPELSRLGNSVTKERIRQIENRAKRDIHHRLNGICPPQVAEALRIVTESTPIAEQDVPVLLRKSGVSSVGLHYAGLRNAAELVDKEWNLVPLTTGKNTVLISIGERTRYAAVLRILSSTRRMTFSVVEETARLAATPSEMEALLRRLIDAHLDYEWLDRDTGVYWHAPGGQPKHGNKILFQCRKLFSLCRRLHIDEVFRGVRRTRTVDKMPDRHVLLEMLRQTEWFVFDGNYVQLREDIRFVELSAKDRRLIRAASGLGSTVRFSELRDNLVREGITSIHAGQHVMFSPFLYRVSRGRYRILFDSEDLSIRRLSSPKSGRRETKGARAHRDVTMATTNGGGGRSTSVVEPVVVIQVSSRVLITDRVFVNSDLPSGHWEVVSLDGCRVGHCKTSRGTLCGLGSALRGVDAKVGDSCRLRFDLASERVEIRRVMG